MNIRERVESIDTEQLAEDAHMMATTGEDYEFSLFFNPELSPQGVQDEEGGLGYPYDSAKWSVDQYENQDASEMPPTSNGASVYNQDEDYGVCNDLHKQLTHVGSVPPVLVNPFPDLTDLPENVLIRKYGLDSMAMIGHDENSMQPEACPSEDLIAQSTGASETEMMARALVLKKGFAHHGNSALPDAGAQCNDRMNEAVLNRADLIPEFMGAPREDNVTTDEDYAASSEAASVSKRRVTPYIAAQNEMLPQKAILYVSSVCDSMRCLFCLDFSADPFRDLPPPERKVVSLARHVKRVEPSAVR